LKEATMPTQHVTILTGLLFAATAAAAQNPVRATTDTTITPAMVARGDSIFHGQIGGAACFGCHGTDAKGVTGLAPNLTSGKWLNGDGSLAAIAQTIEKGVPHPKQAPAPMPPKGGAKLLPSDVLAVAAYVYSLSHPKATRP
jgi:mono/diheme cytochrome c family protein